MRALLACTAVLAATLGGCRPALIPAARAPQGAPQGAAVTPSAASALDSIRGIVERVGSEPTTQLIARPAHGSPCTLATSGASALSETEGLELVMWGERATPAMQTAPGLTCTFTVTRFAVRAVSGIAAVDGLLRAEGASFALETADGRRHALLGVPSSLRSHVGARIYWAGPLDRAPEAYGVLAPRR
jgi:hypothetical protein